MSIYKEIDGNEIFVRCDNAWSCSGPTSTQIFINEKQLREYGGLWNLTRPGVTLCVRCAESLKKIPPQAVVYTKEEWSSLVNQLKISQNDGDAFLSDGGKDYYNFQISSFCLFISPNWEIFFPKWVSHIVWIPNEVGKSEN